MKLGERRGPLPIEEQEWLKEHLYCVSLRKLYEEYSRKFGRPYLYMISFNEALVRANIFPITQVRGYDNLNEMLGYYAEHGAVHWTYKGKSCRIEPLRDPHWLWRWHHRSIKCPSGVSFRPFPETVKEIQFNEQSRDLETD